MTRLGTQLRKLKTAGGIAGFTITAIVAATIPGIALTNASWTSNEFDHSTLGTENCATAANFSTRGAGKLIGGTLLGTNLDNVASLNGVTVTNGSGGVAVSPAGTTSLGSDAYANPLSVTALNSITASLGPLLQVPLSAGVGIGNQVAQARTSGASMGAAGVVDNSGAIALTTSTPAAAVPTFATLDLETVLGQLGLGSVAANVTDLNLSLGAVASSAQLDGCKAMWMKDVYASLVRQYVVAGLTTNINSPLVSNLVSAVNSTTTGLTNTVGAISGNQGILDGVTSNVTSLLGTVLAPVGVGAPTATVSATVDFSALTTLLNSTITDPGNIVKINLAAGTITINTAALFDSVNGLNHQAPNTQLLLNQSVIDSLKSAITSALNAYVASVTGAIDAALSAMKINLSIVVPISTLGPGGGLTISATNASLSSLLAGTVVLGGTLNCTLLPAVCPALKATVNALLIPLVSTLTTGIEVPLATSISALVNPAVSTLLTTLNTTTSGIEAILAGVLQNLFGPGKLLSVVVNAQNAPNPALPGASNPLPVWASGLAGPSTSPYATGRYDVSAIEIVIASAVGTGVSVDLARSSVGSNVVTP